MTRMCFLIMMISSLLVTGCGNDKKSATPAANGVPADATKGTAPAADTKTILFFGNSLSAGYGVDPSETFPALVQQKIDSLNLRYRVVNGGVSGETTAGGVQRLDFVLKQQEVDVFVLELGANDGLRGLPLTETRKNLQAIINKVQEKYPGVKLVLAGMQIPPNMGAAYASGFRDIYPELAAKNQITLIPFLLEGVGGEPRLNQGDGIHPTAEGHRVVARNVWNTLSTVL